MRYKYFIWETRLGYILALSDVKIVSDDKYESYRNAVQKEVREWHKNNKGDDRYLTWKLEWMKKHYSDEEIIKSINHLKGNLMYDYEEIVEKLSY